MDRYLPQSLRGQAYILETFAHAPLALQLDMIERIATRQRSAHEILPILNTILRDHNAAMTDDDHCPRRANDSHSYTMSLSPHDLQAVSCLSLFLEDHEDVMKALVLRENGKAIQRVMENEAVFFAQLLCRPTIVGPIFQVTTTTTTTSSIVAVLATS